MTTKEHEKEAKQVDSVTDFVQEHEDTNLMKGINSLVSNDSGKLSAQIQISQSDIQLMVEELEIPKELCEKLLKGHGGDIRKAMLAYIEGQ